MLCLLLPAVQGVPFQWEFIAATPPPARWLSGVAYQSGFLYMFGGRGVGGKAKGTLVSDPARCLRQFCRRVE